MKRLPRGYKAQIQGQRMFQTMYTAEQMREYAQRQWQGLTDSEFREAVEGLEDLEDCWLTIEAKLKEKNDR